MDETKIQFLERMVLELKEEISREKAGVSCSGDVAIKLDASIDSAFGKGNGLADIKINGKWAYYIFESNKRTHHNGTHLEPWRHKNAMLYLSNCNGIWTTDDGDEIQGYLSYIPKA